MSIVSCTNMLMPVRINRLVGKAATITGDVTGDTVAVASVEAAG